MTLAFWICAALTVVSALVSTGYAVTSVQSATKESKLPSMYALARSMAILVAALIGLVSFSTDYVTAIALVMIIVQALDTVVGVRIRDTFKTVGPAITAAANAAALIWMLTS